ncbi:hypothetical protein Agub_g11603 [Astrephomene gubernaculifera]|uniref:F-box protein n=1 Tax=Astrephomene gubernaculifera TaxID=47775 RepID=A0AAD3DZ88_9CHLO|nr:hypothetical protein Agub_g11603 [Astrephomene gubernaculifera]
MEVQSAGTNKRRSLADVLHQLDLSACDTLVSCLPSSDREQARLVCRQLRRTIDNSIWEVHLGVKASWAQDWQTGEMPSLATFPRCSSVGVTLIHNSEISPADMAALLLLPFIREPLPVRQRITRLVVDRLIGVWLQRSCSCGTAMAALVHWLPSLRELNFRALGPAMSYNPLQQRLMYRSLASLPNLDTLILPSCGGLEHITPLQNTLTCLKAGMLVSREQQGLKILSQAAVAAISQLHKLRKLTFYDCGPLLAHVDGSSDDANEEADEEDDGADPWPPSSLAWLLERLPPSLETLTLHSAPGSKGFYQYDMNFLFQDRACKSLAVKFHDMYGQDERYSQLLASLHPLVEQLTACNTPRLLPLGRLLVNQVHIPHGVTLATGRELQPLRLLMSLAAAVEVETLQVDEGAEVLSAVQALGKPQELKLTARGALRDMEYVRDANNRGWWTGRLVLRGPQHAVALAAPAAEAADPTAAAAAVAAAASDALPTDPLSGLLLPVPSPEQPCSCPSAQEMAWMVLHRLTFGADESRRQMACTAETLLYGSCYAPNKLLLQGSSIGVMLQVRAAFHAFLAQIEEEARSRARSMTRHIFAYQELPAAAGIPAVLLICEDVQGAVDAVVAAVAAAAAAGQDPSALQVERVRGSTSRLRPAGCAAFLKALQEELQALWDDVAARRRVGEREWLRQLLEVWEQLSDLPPAVSLGASV